MNTRQVTLALTTTLVLAPGTWAADAPLGVSPGESGRMSLVELRCPTFSWGAVPGATAYELVVYELPEGYELAETWASATMAGAQPALRTTVPGTASSWTPSLTDCLEAGTRNAWFVRAVSGEQPGDWSLARLFEIAPARPAITLDEAVEVLREHLRSAAAGDRVARDLTLLLGADTGGPGTGAPANVSAESHAGIVGTPAIHGELSDVTGETFGVRGITNSETEFSAGVLGWAKAHTSSAPGVFGVYGVSESASGAGVFGDGVYGVRGASNTSGGAAVWGQHASGSGSATGVFGNSFSPQGRGVYGLNHAASGDGYGVYGESSSSAGSGVYGTGATGVHGDAPTGIGGGTGVSGIGAVGVRGTGVTGVRGFSSDSIGVAGIADTLSGTVTGVYGEATTGSQDGRGVHAVGSGASVGLRAESVNGNHIEAYESFSSRVFYVDQTGNVFADGSYNCGLATGCLNTGTGADVAERIDTSDALQPGDVVEIDPERPGHFRRSRGPRSLLVAGVVSTQPAITLNNNDLAGNESGARTDDRPLLALVGKVPVKASAENGAIRPGDFLTTASIPGHAARCEGAERCFGRTIGKALEGLAEGTGTVLTMVDLQ